MRRRALAWTAVIVVAIVVAGTTIFWVEGQLAHSGSPAPTCLCGAFAVGNPTEQHQGGSYWTNFTIETTGGGLELGNLKFQVQADGGANLSPTGWSLYVVDQKVHLVGAYDWSSESWSSGGSVVASSLQTIVLETPTSLVNRGLTFVVNLATGGTDHTEIP